MSTSWTAKRQSGIFVTRLVYSLVIAVFLTTLLILISAFLHLLGSAKTPDDLAREMLVGKLGLFGNIVSDPTAAKILTPISVPAALLCFGLITFWKGRSVAERIFDRFFVDLHYDLIRRATPPLAIDPLHGATDLAPLGWIPPSGHRQEIWDSLNFLLDHETGDGRSSLFKSGRFRTFGWIMVLGRSGAGKSRTILEYALAISRDDRSRLGKAIGWIRHHFWLTRRAATDPWDAGFIGRRPDIDTVGTLTALIEGWRPRKPTLLIIDDPEPGWAEAAIQTISAQSIHYRHPVRLILVNQTVPTGLAPRADGRGGVTRTGSGSYDGEMRLGEEARLTAPEMRKAAASRNLPTSIWRGSDREVALLETVTEGNPLILELALLGMANGIPITQQDRESLINDRCERVLHGLQAAGLKSDVQLQAVAVSSLAGGAAIPAMEEYLGPLALDEVALVARAFPAERITGDEARLPPIRPELIGDGFARMLVSSRFADRQQPFAEQLALAAWASNPGGMSRTALRLARRANGEPMAAAAVAAVRNIKPDNPDVIMDICASVATMLFYGQSPSGTGTDVEEEWLAAVIDMVDRLAQPERLQLIGRLTAMLIDDDDEFGTLRADAGRRGGIFATALLGSISTAELDAEAARDLIRQAEKIMCKLEDHDLSRSDNAFFVDIVERLLVEHADIAGQDEIHALAHNLTHTAIDVYSAERATRKITPMANEYPDWTDLQHRLAQAWQLLAHYQSLENNLEATQQAASTVKYFLDRSNGDSFIASLTSDCFNSVAYVHMLRDDFAAARAVADQLHDDMQPFLDIERVVYKVIQAYYYASRSLAIPVEEVEYAANRVEALCIGHPDDIDFARLRAKVWATVAITRCDADDVGGGQEVALLVDGIANAFPTDPDLFQSRMWAWDNVAWGYSQTSQAKQIEDILSWITPKAASFPLDHLIQCHLARSWRHLAFATSDAATADRAATEIHHICLAFGADEDLHLEKVRALQFTLSLLLDSDAFEKARSVLAKLEATAANYRDGLDVQSERTIAWELITKHPEMAAEARAMALDIATLGERFPDDDNIVAKAALARSSLQEVCDIS